MRMGQNEQTPIILIGAEEGPRIYFGTEMNFTDIDKKNIEENSKARHTHDNKEILDSITQEDVDNWNNKGNNNADTYTKEEINTKLTNYPAKDEAILTPTNAKVGQTIIVKEVDDSGKPISWEAVDVSGGNTEWELISEVKTSEEVNLISLTTDINGNTFELGDVCVYIEGRTQSGTIYPYLEFIGDNGKNVSFDTTLDTSPRTAVVSRKDDRTMIKIEKYQYDELKVTKIYKCLWNIKGFNAQTFGNEVFPIGTTIKLYGRKV